MNLGDLRSEKEIRHIVKLAAAILMAAGIIIVNFIILFIISKNNIITSWRNTAVRTSEEINGYLQIPMDAVTFTAVSLNEMIRMGAPEADVRDYLALQTDVYKAAVNDNSTGVYAYYQGKYMDGSGWIPPDHYQPKGRPWYLSALAAKGKTTLVDPYLNQQMKEYTLSVSKLLEDGESVVSMDIYLDGLQNLADSTAEDEVVEAVFVMNLNGGIIVQSDTSRFDLWLHRIEKQFGLSVLEEIKRSDIHADKYVWNDEGKHLILKERINDDWVFVIMLNSDRMFSSLRVISLFFAMSILLVFAIIFGVFWHINRRRREAEHLYDEVCAIADIYDTVLKTDFRRDTLHCILKENQTSIFSDCGDGHFRSWAETAPRRISSERSLALLTQFMDPDTLEERLQGIRSITHEFMDIEGRWNRIRFIVIDRDFSDRPVHLLIAIESIDEDRKRRENLRRLSETDLMTGVLNRGAGERMVRQLLNEGKRGMFCLMDADAFKSINDNFGHKTGDKVIIGIADAISRAFRESDVVFRLGGDEFAVYAAGVTEQRAAENVMSRLFENLNNMDIPELGDRKVTVSVGASFFPASREDTFETLYERADKGTYESKKTRGNKTTYK